MDSVEHDWAPELQTEYSDLVDSGDTVQHDEYVVEGSNLGVSGHVSAVVKCKLTTFLRDGKKKTEAMRKISKIVKDANVLLGEAYAFANLHVMRLLESSQPIPIINRNFYYRCLLAVGQAECIDTTLGEDFKASLIHFDKLRADTGSETNCFHSSSKKYNTNPLGKTKVDISEYNQLVASLSIQMTTMASNHLLTNLDKRLRSYLEWRHPSLKRFHWGIVKAVLFKPAEDAEVVLRASSAYHKPKTNEEKIQEIVNKHEGLLSRAEERERSLNVKIQNLETAARRAEEEASAALASGSKTAVRKAGTAARAKTKLEEARAKLPPLSAKVTKAKRDLDRRKEQLNRESIQLGKALQVAQHLRSLLSIQKPIKYANQAHLSIPLYAWLLKETESAQKAASAQSTPFKGRTFSLLPLKGGFTTSYVPISSMFLLRILRDLKMSSHHGDGRGEDTRQAWDKLFCVRLVETQRRRFAESIMTDGYAVSALLACSVPLNTSTGPGMSNIEQVRQKVSEAVQAGKTVRYSGTDPGFNDVTTSTDSSGRCVSYSSSRYYEKARIKYSNRKVKKYNEQLNHLTEDLKGGGRVATSNQFEMYLKAYLAHLPVLISHRMERPYRKLRFLRHVSKQLAVEEIVDQILDSKGVGGSKDLLQVIGFGDWSGGSQSAVSRKHCGPIQLIKHKLSQRENVLVTPVDESNTSKLDSNTWKELRNMKSKETVVRQRDGSKKVYHNYKVHVVLHCKPSDGEKLFARLETTWDRDVNASRNILMLLRMDIKGFERPAPFCRKSKKPDKS